MFLFGIVESFLLIVLKIWIIILGIFFFLEVKESLLIFFEKVFDVVIGLNMVIMFLVILYGKEVKVFLSCKLFELNWIFICIVKIFIELGFILMGIFYVLFLLSIGMGGFFFFFDINFIDFWF